MGKEQKKDNEMGEKERAKEKHRNKEQEKGK